jgi:hypothetical protein
MTTEEIRPPSLVRTRAITRAAALAGLALASAHAAAQIGQRTGAVRGFPQFYESSVSKDCSVSTDCNARFGLVPANHLLEATNISCHGIDSTKPGTSGKSATFLLLQLRDPDPNLDKNIFSVPVDDPTDIARSTYTFNQPVRSFFPGQSRPSVTFFSGDGFFACKLSGTLVPASANAIQTE